MAIRSEMITGMYSSDSTALKSIWSLTMSVNTNRKPTTTAMAPPNGPGDGPVHDGLGRHRGEEHRGEAGEQANEAVRDAPVPRGQEAPAGQLVADHVADEAGEQPDDRPERVAEERHEREGRAHADGGRARDRHLDRHQDAVQCRADGRVDDRSRVDGPHRSAIHGCCGHPKHPSSTVRNRESSQRRRRSLLSARCRPLAWPSRDHVAGERLGVEEPLLGSAPLGIGADERGSSKVAATSSDPRPRSRCAGGPSATIWPSRNSRIRLACANARSTSCVTR